MIVICRHLVLEHKKAAVKYPATVDCIMVETTGFEPATSCSRSKRSTKLSHVSLRESLYYKIYSDFTFCKGGKRKIHNSFNDWAK